ncbi:MAG TPA: WG repeat-containing protein, partial [Salinimicrobium sp.]|nr:WG repeat-containing protein [Salinimicrobium sp.]
MKLNQYQWDPENDFIAAGAFAEVYKARDRNNSNRYVALKIYKEGVAQGSIGNSTSNNKYSLEQEFKKVDGLSHTNIISYYGMDYIKHQDALGRSLSYPVIIMEYASGGTLLEYLQTNPEDQTIEKIIRGIIEGVHYLHSEGTVHRDLKPGNILITTNRRGEPIPKITDFGISKDTLEENLEETRTEAVGTPHYMAPEQFFKNRFGLNGEIGEQADIWAVGVIVYRILTGIRPFGHNSNDYEEIRDSIVNTSPDLSVVPPKYRSLVNSCLKKNAAERPQTAAEILSKIEEPPKLEEDATMFSPLAEEDVTVINPPITEKPKRKTTAKNKIVPAIIGLIAVMGITGFFLGGDKEEISQLAVVKLDGKYGYIDKEGKEVIEFKYDAAWCMSEGMGLVSSKGKWGFINKDGDLIIDFMYDAAHPFSEDLAAVELNGKWGFIDKNGQLKIPLVYEGARSFSGGMAPVKTDELWGYIDKNNQMLIPPQYESAYPFAEGLAVVRMEGKEGFINQKGEVVIPATYDLALEFSDGLAAVAKDSKWGFIDKTGKQIIPLTYDNTWGFSEGLA